LAAECAVPQVPSASLRKHPGSLEGKLELVEKYTQAVEAFFRYRGLDIMDESIQDTPLRVIKALMEMTSGYTENPTEILSKIFPTNSDGLVIVKDIPFHSLCEHHLLPFSGTATVAYLPKMENGQMFNVGLSKIPRAVQALAQRLQTQERLTNEIVNALRCVDGFNCAGIAAVVESVHSCACVRGVKSHGSSMITSVLTGVFKTDAAARQELFTLIKGV